MKDYADKINWLIPIEPQKLNYARLLGVFEGMLISLCAFVVFYALVIQFVK